MQPAKNDMLSSQEYTRVGGTGGATGHTIFLIIGRKVALSTSNILGWFLMHYKRLLAPQIFYTFHQPYALLRFDISIQNILIYTKKEKFGPLSR